MSDYAYISAYSILLEAEDRCFGASIDWKWQLQDDPAPSVTLTWSLHDQCKHRKCTVTAKGRTFETALIRLAGRFVESPLAKDIDLNMRSLAEDRFVDMTVLSGYEVRLESVEKDRVVMASYDNGIQIAAAESNCIDGAIRQLAQTVRPKPIRQLENPRRFHDQWRFLEKKLRFYWEEGSCLQMIAAAVPESDVIDIVSPSSNTQVRTFLHYSDLSPEHALRSCSGITFEAALDAFAKSFGWKEEVA